MKSGKKNAATRRPARPAATAKSAAFSGEAELIVISNPSSALRARGTAVASAAGANVTGIESILAAAGATMMPLFGATEERVLSDASRAPGAPVEHMARFYRVAAPEGRLKGLAEKLRARPEVEAAYVKPPTVPPVIQESAPPLAEDAPPTTPDFVASQIYLNAAPEGIDALFAWTRPGGSGAGVRIIDVEGAWRFTHEDLTQNQGGVVGGTQYTERSWRDHGTAVLGEFSGDRNSIGVTGICPDANVRAISHGTIGSAAAIRRAADLLGAGDIILLEMHRPGPRHNFASRDDQLGYIAVEWWPDDLAAIQYATSRGILVVEAAGNGAENLDDALYNTRPAGFPASWTNPFRRTVDSGAVIVGAGAPPPGTHGRDHGADRSRLDFSNFGSCVDVQGWGREVTTCGYGLLQGGMNEDLWYTDRFAGTSSASPIVTGALGSLQGGLRAAHRPLLTPATARQLLRTTGTPQQNGPNGPATQRIGNRPDLRQAFTQLGIGGKQVKEFVKEAVKDTKEIHKERKDTKEAAKDAKDIQKERKDGKEGKELIKERKEFAKENVKEAVKERKEFKEFKEKEKDAFEHGGGVVIRQPAPTLEARVAELEQTLAQIAHFISPDLRPDLATSALGQEADLQALSAQLQQESAAAKDAKDQKDLEKLPET